MLSVEKPGSPAEILEHHGTKGMKWGVRKNTANARFNSANPTSARKADAIRLARARSNVRFEQATRVNRGSKAERKAAKLTYLKHPDRATALRMTRGEKVVTGILAGAFAPTVVVPVGIGVGTAGQLAFRKHVERKQARGGYN